MKRLTGWLAAAMFMAMPAASFAGEAAELNVLGFARDGGVFAFEEFGVQDGSGFPYANRFYIDTTNDTFMAGAPVRIRIDSDGAELAQARSDAAAAGEAIVAASEFKPGFMAAFNAITEQSADPMKVVALPRPVFPPVDKPVGLRLEEINVPSPADCAAMGPVKGFRLVRFDPETNADIAILHEDDRVPASRNCPQGYRLGGLQTYMETGAFAVIIAIRAAGFEGPNHRWLAVTGKL